MQIPSPSGKGKSDQIALRPPWTVMLNYEFELRKEAVKRAFRDSRALKDTILEVQNDAQLKEQFFTSPIALQHRNMPAPSTWYERPNGQPWKWRRNDKGPGKGKGKDSPKGKEPKGKKGKKKKGHGELASRTPDGRMICFAYSTYWSGHSARHTLPSIAAALDVGKDRWDFLGRWCYAQHGSQDYILTSRQVVHGIQNLISKTVLEGNADGGYIEEEVLAGVKQACPDLALDQQTILRRHMVSKWDTTAKCWKLYGRCPLQVHSS